MEQVNLCINYYNVHILAFLSTGENLLEDLTIKIILSEFMERVC